MPYGYGASKNYSPGSTTRESYRTSNAYNSNSYNAGITTSNKKTSTRSNNTSANNNVKKNVKETYKTTTYKKTTISPEQKRKNELALKVAKEKKDAEAFKTYTYKPKNIPSIFGSISSKLIGEKTFNVNKSYYERNVKGKAKPGGGFYGASIQDFQGYMKGRGSGSIDAMGKTISTGNDRNTSSTVKPNNTGSYVVEKNIGGKTLLTTAPTTAEVSQSEAADVVEDSIEKRKRRNKAKGRSPTILTGVTGVTGSLTLGKPSLLGR